jgi:hypothetical protein
MYWLFAVAHFRPTAAQAGVHYVDVNGTNATPPYTNWSTAATHPTFIHAVFSGPGVGEVNQGSRWFRAFESLTIFYRAQIIEVG